MDINSVDKSIEYEFEEAKKELLEGSNVIITSKVTEDSYIAEKSKGKVMLKYYNSALSSWRKCEAIEPREIFGKWYINKIVQ
jgi:hypothetical protein|nr:MAG TPA: hypothetical protein [Caudoviricetes sp.]